MITYRVGNDLDLDGVIELYRASTLGERRSFNLTGTEVQFNLTGTEVEVSLNRRIPALGAECTRKRSGE